jgi:hypothetical protein
MTNTSRPIQALLHRAAPGLAALALLAPWAPAAAQETAGEPGKTEAQQVVAKSVAFHGGELYRGSKTSLTITSRSGSFRVISRVDGDLFDHTVITKRQGTREVRATNDTVEVRLNGEPVPVEPGQEQGLRDFVSARVYFPFLPYRLGDPGVYTHDLGTEEWDGRALRKIKVTFEPGSSTDANDEYLYWFDPESGRLEQFAYSFVAGGGGLRLRKGFNYRRVGGLLFFDSDNYGIDGQGMRVEQITPAFAEKKMKKISTVTLTDIEVEPLG